MDAGADAGDLRSGGDFKFGEEVEGFSRGSLSFEDDGVYDAEDFRTLGLLSTCFANPGRGSDIGSDDDDDDRRCEDNLTGASGFRFSGRSSHSGVPGRPPSSSSSSSSPPPP